MLSVPCLFRETCLLWEGRGMLVAHVCSGTRWGTSTGTSVQVSITIVAECGSSCRRWQVLMDSCFCGGRCSRALVLVAGSSLLASTTCRCVLAASISMR